MELIISYEIFKSLTGTRLFITVCTNNIKRSAGSPLHLPTYLPTYLPITYVRTIVYTILSTREDPNTSLLLWQTEGSWPGLNGTFATPRPQDHPRLNTHLHPRHSPCSATPDLGE
jgi:hypothetical protein